MSYPILVIRTPEEAPDALYPQAGTQPDSVSLCPDDGETIELRCNGLRTERQVDGKMVTMGELAGCSASVVITQSRVIVACSRFAKGSRLRGYGAGGLIVAGLANVASQAIATHRQRGQMLVGHVRYEWMAGAIARDHKGFRSANQISLLMRDPTGPGFVMLLIQLDKRDRASSHVEGIVSRAARLQARLAQSSELRAKLEAYAESPERTVSAETEAVSYVLPTHCDQ